MWLSAKVTTLEKGDKPKNAPKVLKNTKNALKFCILVL